MTDASGNVLSNFPHKYTAFGMDDPHYVAPSEMRRYTGKERDAESGMDYYGARHFGSSMGRFLSPDPDMGTLLHVMSPQRWNMYAYALNNPLVMIDPTGKDAAAVDFSGMVGPFGHEAIVSINPDGSAQMASFGPAEQSWKGGWGLSEPGQVHTWALHVTIQFGADGLPTDASMNALKDTVAQEENVDPSTVRINYFKTTPQETAQLNVWIAQQKAKPGRYRFCSTNCANFTKQALLIGGAITRSQANGLSIEPNEMFFQLALYAPESSDSSDNAKVTVTECDKLPDGTQHCYQHE
jgi:RHS repeat-associated protein